jgi:NADPH:quinone reductase
VIGYDAAGVVVEAGPQASLFRPGDEVFYAGSIIRSGTNAEFHLVDERIVGHKPRSLGFAEAAALPLTSITAWEALFDRMDIRKPVAGAAPSVLISVNHAAAYAKLRWRFSGSCLGALIFGALLFATLNSS